MSADRFSSSHSSTNGDVTVVNNPAPAMASHLTVGAIDITAMGVFAWLARLAHKSAEPLNLHTWWSTAMPFMLGALIATVVFIITRAHGKRLWPGGGIAWACCIITGLGIWAVHHHAVPHWSFMLVASTMSALLLFGWRAAARGVSKKLSR